MAHLQGRQEQATLDLHDRKVQTMMCLTTIYRQSVARKRVCDMTDNELCVYVPATLVNKKCEICGTPGPNLHPHWDITGYKEAEKMPSVLCKTCLDRVVAMLNLILAAP